MIKPIFEALFLERNGRRNENGDAHGTDWNGKFRMACADGTVGIERRTDR
jgi:hypothetical protein